MNHHGSGAINHLQLTLLRSFLGQRLNSVAYKLEEHASPYDFITDDTVHEVGHAVILAMDTVTAVIEWKIENYDEYINISSVEGSASRLVSRTLDVSDLPQWSRSRGASIIAVGMATQEGEDEQLLPWSLRIETSDGSAFVFALGELGEDGPEYRPNSLLVMFDRRAAEQFKVSGWPNDPWGRDVLN